MAQIESTCAAACARRDGLCARRRARQPADGADRQAGEAGGLFRRKIAHHRFRAVERAEFRHPAHRRRDAIQGAQPHPPPAARLELLPPGAERELRHPAGQPARLRDDVVRGNGRRRLPEHRHHRELRAVLHRHARRRPRLQDGLRADAASARRVGRRRDRRLHRGAAHGGGRLRRDGDRRRPTASPRSWRSRRTRPACPTTRTWRWPAWASTSSRRSS